MAQGRTLVEILHPEDHINLDNTNDMALTLRQLQTALNALAIGVLGHQDTTVYVAQGGVQASGSVALSGVGGTAATGSYALSGVGGTAASGYVEFNSASGSGTATINGVVFPWTFDTDDTTTAFALYEDIFNSTDPLILGVLTVAVNGGDPTRLDIVADAKGTDGNAITLAVTGTGAASSAATLTGGQDGAVTVAIDGTSVGPVDVTDLTDTAAATAVAAAIEADGTLGPLLAAVGSTTNVSLTWGAKGTAGNVTLGVGVSTTGTATRSGATMTGGAQGSVTITVQGTAEVTDTTNLTDAAAAALCAEEISANDTINDLATATADGDDVVITANAYGLVGNLITLAASSATGTATDSGSNLAGGTEATGQFLERP